MSAHDPNEREPNRRSSERRQVDRVLRKSEERQREVLEHGAVGVAYWDLDGCLLFLNERAVKNLGGTSREEFLGKSLTKMFGDDAGGVYLARIRKAAASPEPMEYVDCVELPIGRRWLSSLHTRSLDAAGNVVGVHVYANDITGRKQVEEALRASEERFRAIADYTYDWESWIGTDGRLLWVNPAVERVTGHTVAECMEMPDYPAPLFHEDERDVVAALFQPDQTKQGRIVNDVTSRIRRKDGSVLWVSISFQPIYSDEGIPLGQRSSIRDITERKQAEEALQQTERSLLEAQELAHVGSWTYDPVTQQPTWSEGMFSIWGLDPREGAPAYSDHGKWIHPEDYQRFDDAVREAVEHGTPYEIELRICRPDGVMRTVVSICRPQFDTSGRVVSLKGTNQDVTARKQAELERLALQRQLELSQKLESLGVLAGGIAHDFNNILASVLGNAELALAELSPSAHARENLLEITQASHRAATLCRQMLAYSGRGQFVIEPIDLSAFIEDMLGSIDEVSTSQRICLRSKVTPVSSAK